MTSSPRMLVLQPSELNPLGPLGDWLQAAGAQLEVLRPATDPLPSTVDDYQAVVCLGGELNADSEIQYPWLRQVRALLAAAVTHRRPVLAIGLGAQLLALATGGSVRAGERGPEVGTLLVAKRDTATDDALFRDAPMTPDALQFHTDEIHQLPPGATLLAASPRYPNQAFRVGESAYGFQFHIETTPELVLEWASRRPELAAVARVGQFEREHLEAIHQDLAETWRPIVERFVRLASGELPASVSGRHLPIV